MTMTGRELTDQNWKRRTMNQLATLPQFVSDYYNYLSGKSEKTKLDYIRKVKNILEFLPNEADAQYDPIGELTDNTLYKFKDIPVRVLRKYFYSYLPEVKGASKSTCATYYSAIRSFFQFLIDDEVVSGMNANPMNRVQRPVDDKEHQPFSLTKEEVHLIMTNIDNHEYKGRNRAFREAMRARDKVIIYLSLTTGMRVGTLTELNVDDVDYETQTITVVSKGGREEIFALTDKTMDHMVDWLDARCVMANAGEDALFVHQHGGRMSPNAVAGMLDKFSKGISRPISPHKLRSTCATTMYEKTHDIYAVSDYLGHKQVTTTQRYISKTADKHRKGANIVEDAFDF